MGSFFSTYFLHVLHGDGYQWWSGAGSDLGELTLVGIALGVVRHHNCHQRRCWRPGHRHPEHGWPSCKQHWASTPEHVNQASEGETQ